MTLAPRHHHEDCDFRLSSAAVEIDQTFGVPEGEQPNEVHDCNLGCAPDYTVALVAYDACMAAEPDDVPSLIEAARALRDYIHRHTPAMYRPDGYDEALNAIIVRLQGDS